MSARGAAAEPRREEEEMPNMTLRIRLGPLVSFEVEGGNCRELTEALEGFEKLNRRIDAMCSDLAERVYPEEADSPPTEQEMEP